MAMPTMHACPVHCIIGYMCALNYPHVFPPLTHSVVIVRMHDIIMDSDSAPHPLGTSRSDSIETCHLPSHVVTCRSLYRGYPPLGRSVSSLSESHAASVSVVLRAGTVSLGSGHADHFTTAPYRNSMMSRQTMIRGRMAADRLTYSTLLTIDSVESSDVWQPECALPRKHPGTPERACVHYIEWYQYHSLGNI